MYISYNASAKNLVSRYWSLFYTWGEKGLSEDLKGITWFSEVREGEPIVANRVDKGWLRGEGTAIENWLPMRREH